MYGASKRTCRFLLLIYYVKAINIFECMEITEYIYESVVGTPHKKLLEQVLAVLVT